MFFVFFFLWGNFPPFPYFAAEKKGGERKKRAKEEPLPLQNEKKVFVRKKWRKM